jgi:hypothetical protein
MFNLRINVCIDSMYASEVSYKEWPSFEMLCGCGFQLLQAGRNSTADIAAMTAAAVGDGSSSSSSKVGGSGSSSKVDCSSSSKAGGAVAAAAVEQAANPQVRVLHPQWQRTAVSQHQWRHTAIMKLCVVCMCHGW